MAFDQEFENSIKEICGFQSKILQTLAVTAYESADDPDKLECISFYAGRHSKYMVRAVERHPEDFRNEEISLWDLLALLTLARVSRKKDRELYQWWKINYLTTDAWTLINRVKDLGKRAKRRDPNRIQASGYVKFESDHFTVKPSHPIAGRSNGTYQIELKRRKKGNPDE